MNSIFTVRSKFIASVIVQSEIYFTIRPKYSLLRSERLCLILMSRILLAALCDVMVNDLITNLMEVISYKRLTWCSVSKLDIVSEFDSHRVPF